MEHYLIEQGYIPLDKSWINRMGFLDLTRGYPNDIKSFLEHQENLNADILSLKKVVEDWGKDKPLDVGESGTLYRFFRFYFWANNIDTEIIRRGTLQERDICDNPEIVDYPLEKLLTLDNGTSQWASASVLLGNPVAVANSPYKLELTYEAVAHWEDKRDKGECWEPRYDETILRQAEAFLELLKTGETKFEPKHSEDACSAIALGVKTIEQAAEEWSSIVGHESNRILEMEKMLGYADQGMEIDSRDHRVIQAIAMYQKVKGREIKVKYPYKVNKSWPQFWRFLDNSQ